MNEKLIQAEQIVSKRFNPKDENYGILVLSCYALLTKFENYTPVIKELYETCEFHIGNKPLVELLQDEKFSFKILDKHLNVNTLVGLSTTGNNSFFESKKNCYTKTTPKIFCSTIDKETEALDTMIHELSHLIKSRINNVYIDSKGNIIKRSGLQISRKNKHTNEALDEAINSLQTSDMTEKIKELNPKNMRQEIKVFYDKLNQKQLGGISGEIELAILLLPLWDNEQFKSTIEDNIVEGKLDIIENDFNQIIGNSQAFSEFSEAFDIIRSSKKMNKTAINRANFILNICKLYNLKSQYIKKFIK